MPKHEPASGSSPEARAMFELARAVHRLATAAEASNRNQAQLAREIHEQGKAIKAHAESGDRLVAAVMELLSEPEPNVQLAQSVDMGNEPDPDAAPTHYLSGKPINGTGSH